MVEEVTAVGVPLMSPLEASIERPAGRVGEIVQETTVPPLADGVAAVIAVPFVKVYEFCEYEMTGAASLTTMVIVAVSLPPVLVAVMV